MNAQLEAEELKELAPVGHYLALRIGFAFPLEEVNALPDTWVEHYTHNRFLLSDPVVRWVYAHTGWVRWSDITEPDPRHIMQQARAFGLTYGVTVCYFDDNRDGQRSFGSFVRRDREFTDEEAERLLAHITRLHIQKAPPTNLTQAEIEALRMVKEGQRLKQIAHVLGVTEGAVKQRLRNAKMKLGANTSAQAAAMASEFGLI